MYTLVEKTLEELYELVKHKVNLERIKTQSGKWIEVFPAPGEVLINIDFPEFTCLCPRTSQPDFATITIKYIPKDWCIELKSWKFYLNSFRNEGHFHEEVVSLIERDIRLAIFPKKLTIIGDFNVRGGTHPLILSGDKLDFGD